MTELVKCDNCERSAASEPLLTEMGWRRVEYISDAHSPMSATADMHFCSLRCLSQYMELLEQRQHI